MTCNTMVLIHYRYSVLCFCFKQKTAYEMRISDWSSDVCSSDLCGTTRGSNASTIPSPDASTATSRLAWCRCSLMRRDPHNGNGQESAVANRSYRSE